MEDSEQFEQAELSLFCEMAESILEGIEDAIIATNVIGKIRYLNSAAELLIGCSQAETLGQFINDLEPALTPLLHQALHGGNATERALQSKAARTIFLRQAIGEGERVVNGLATPLATRQAGTIGIVLCLRPAAESRLSWQAAHDSLTGLLNRRQIEILIEAALSDAALKNEEHSIIFYNLDRFKLINEIHGHAAGDEALRQISQFLAKEIRKTDSFARSGGDEFITLLYGCSATKAAEVARNICSKVSQEFRFSWQGKRYLLGISAGVTNLDGDPNSVITIASNACLSAKQAGRNRAFVQLSSDRATAKYAAGIQLLPQISQGLEQNMFCLWQQRIMAIAATETCAKFEILLRLETKGGKILMPGEFLPVAERYNLMGEIDRWVIRAVFNQRQQWLQETSAIADDYLYAINLSGTSVCDESFLLFLERQFEEYQIEPRLICFEITETIALENLNRAARFVRQLQKLGCKFALDDFGSGASWMSYLRHLPCDVIKIYGGFVQNLLKDSLDAGIVEAILHISRTLGAQTVAEFVKSEEILEKLRELGVDYAQGYGIERPKPLNQDLKAEEQ